MFDFAGRNSRKRAIFTYGEPKKTGWKKPLILCFIVLSAITLWIIISGSKRTNNNETIELALNIATNSSIEQLNQPDEAPVIESHQLQAPTITESNNSSSKKTTLADLYSPKNIAEPEHELSDIDETDAEIEIEERSVLDNLTELAEQQAIDELAPNWQQYKIISGDTLSGILQKKIGLSYNYVTYLLAADKNALSNIRPGQVIEYRIEADKLLELTLKDSKYLHVFTANAEEKFSYEKQKIEITWNEEYYQGVIHTTLGDAINAMGLGIGVTAQVANIMGERLDFRRDVRVGDEFAIVIKHGEREGKPVATNVQAIYYKGSRAQLMAMQHKDERFYDKDGKSLQIAFQRHPYIKKVGISSTFGFRKDPKTGKPKTQHNGTDYRMNIGTPVVSTSEGTVIKSAYSDANGNYVVIKHNEKYKTYYLHLDKRLVKTNDKVKMGQKIGLSGNTGRSTGPHLHYGFYVNDRPVDSLKVQLPESLQLSSKDTATLNANTIGWQNALKAMLDKPTQTASE